MRLFQWLLKLSGHSIIRHLPGTCAREWMPNDELLGANHKTEDRAPSRPCGRNGGRSGAGGIQSHRLRRRRRRRAALLRQGQRRSLEACRYHEAGRAGWHHPDSRQPGRAGLRRPAGDLDKYLRAGRGLRLQPPPEDEGRPPRALEGRARGRPRSVVGAERRRPDADRQAPAGGEVGPPRSHQRPRCDGSGRGLQLEQVRKHRPHAAAAGEQGQPGCAGPVRNGDRQSHRPDQARVSLRDSRTAAGVERGPLDSAQGGRRGLRSEGDRAWFRGLHG